MTAALLRGTIGKSTTLPCSKDGETVAIKNKLFPFTFEEWEEVGDYGDQQFCNVVFTKDFGPFKKDEKLDCLAFFSDQALLMEYSIGGRPLRQVNVHCVPGRNDID